MQMEGSLMKLIKVLFAAVVLALVAAFGISGYMVLDYVKTVHIEMLLRNIKNNY